MNEQESIIKSDRRNLNIINIIKIVQWEQTENRIWNKTDGILFVTSCHAYKSHYLLDLGKKKDKREINNRISNGTLICKSLVITELVS